MKASPSKTIHLFYWGIFNTYTIALLEILLAVVCLRRGEFGRLGTLTIVLALVVFLVWSFYWFFF